MPAEPAKRIEELEIQVAFQQRQLEELDDLVREIRADIERLRHEVPTVRTAGVTGPPPLTENPDDL